MVQAGAAAVAAVRVRLHAHQAEAVEQPVDRAQGAEETAEAAVAENAGQQDGNEDDPLAGEDPAQHLKHGRVGGVGQVAGRALQGARRADILAEGRQGQAPGQGIIQRKGDHEHRQDDVFHPGQRPGCLSLADLRHGQLMKQVLDQAHGAQPAADRPAQDNAEEQDHAQHIPAGPVSRGSQGVLQRPQGAGPRRAGTGIAVQAGDAQRLGLSLIDFSFNESPQVRVVQKRRVQLDKPPFRRTEGLQPGDRVPLIQGPHTPYRY